MEFVRLCVEPCSCEVSNKVAGCCVDDVCISVMCVCVCQYEVVLCHELMTLFSEDYLLPCVFWGGS